MRRFWYGLILVASAALIGILALAGWPSPVAAADVQTLRVANELYNSGEIDDAIQLYEQLANSGIRNVTLFYNLGMAYNAVGNAGGAMLNFRRAEALAPRDPAIRAQLAALRPEAGARPPVRDLPQQLERWLETAISQDETAALALAAWLVFALLLFLTGALRPGFLRSALRALSIIAGVCAIAAILAFGARVYVSLFEPPAVVMRNASPGPEPGVASERAPLNPGAEVAVLERNGEWVQILLPGSSNVGWVPADAIALVG